MASVTVHLASFRNGSVEVSMTYNDANNSVQSVTVANSSDRTMTCTVWKLDNPATTATRIVAPGPPQVFSNLGGGWRFSPVELPEGSPNATNVGYSVSF